MRRRDHHGEGRLPRIERRRDTRAFRLVWMVLCLGVWAGCGPGQDDVPRRLDPRGANLLGAAQRAYVGGDLGSAATLLDSAEIYIPDAADLWFLRGRVLSGLYRFEASDSAFQKALAIDPDYRSARFYMGHNDFLQSTYHAKDGYRAALRYYTAEAELLRRTAADELRRGEDLIRSDGAVTAGGPTEGARPASASGGRPEGGDARRIEARDALTTVLLQIGTTYHRLNRPDSARLYYLRALDADSTLARGYAWLAGIEQSLGRFDAALGNARRAAALEPENPEYALLIGVILNDLSRYEEAMPYLIRAAGELPTNRTAVHSLGTAMVATGAREEGAAYLARGDSMEVLRAQIEQAHMGIFHDPKDPIRWENYAFLLHQAGHMADARRAIQVMRQVSSAPSARAEDAAHPPTSERSNKSPRDTASQSRRAAVPPGS